MQATGVLPVALGTGCLMLKDLPHSDKVNFVVLFCVPSVLVIQLYIIKLAIQFMFKVIVLYVRGSKTFVFNTSWLCTRQQVYYCQ